MPANKRPGLTRDSMIDAALRLLNEVGLDGLTVRRLATELGVQSPALYWHIRTKQELLDGMADAIVRGAGMGPPRTGESWQDWLTRRSRAFRSSLLAHRDGARIVSNATRLSPETVELFERELAAMVDRGFTPVLALHTITALSHYVNGFVLQEQTEGRPSAGDGIPPAGARRTALADAPGDGTPATLMAAIREGGSPVGEQAFQHGLQALIDGSAIALAASRSGRSGQ